MYNTLLNIINLIKINIMLFNYIMRKTISKRRLNNRRRVKKTRRHNMKGGKPIARNESVIKRIVLYGLSANPPTKAHENIIEQLSENYDAVFVWASTNPNKLDSTHKDYDPLYKDEKTRSKFLMNVLTGLNNVKVDYDPNGTPAKYNDQYTGISVKKFIDANLVSDGYTTINNGSIKLNQFKLNASLSSRDDVAFLNQCDINEKDIVELWVCFGLDVVRDTPTWTPNNVFLTKATGIVMISREGESAGNGLFSHAYLNKSNIPYYKMPFLDSTTIREDRFVEKDLKFNKDSFSELFKPENKEMHDLVNDLLSASQQQFIEINKNSKLSTATEKRTAFLEWLNKIDDKFSLVIEESTIKLGAAFSSASSTKVRNLAVHIILGNNRSTLADQMLKYVNGLIINNIYTTYGNPTIPEQLAIVKKKEQMFLQNDDETYDKFKTCLKNAVLKIME